MMEENKKWRISYSEYPESDKGVENIGQTIVHVILALIILGVAYTFFAKTEWETVVVKSPALKTNIVESRAEEGQTTEEMS